MIEPSRKIQHADDAFDVIVIGAGYTGLTAARDASTNGSSPSRNINQRLVTQAKIDCRVKDTAS